MPAGAVDADEDTEVHAQPRRLRSSAVAALVIAGQTADPRYYPLEEEGGGGGGGGGSLKIHM